MPKLIEVPGHGEVEFPDDMSDAQIIAAIEDLTRPRAALRLPTGVPGLEVTPDQAQRFLRGAATGVGKMVGGTLQLAAKLPGVSTYASSLGMMGGADAAISQALAHLPEPEGVAGQLGEFAAMAAPSLALPVLGVAGEAAMGAAQAQATGGNPLTGAVLGGTLRGATKAMPVARFLRSSATRTYEKAIHPTMQRTKAIMRMQGERMMQEPLLRGQSLEQMAEVTAQQRQRAGRAVEQVWSQFGNTIVPIAPILKALDRVKARRTVSGVAFSPMVQKVEDLQQKLVDISTHVMPDGTRIPIPVTADDLRVVRQGLDDIAQAAGGFSAHREGSPFGDLATQTAGWTAREARRIIAKELVKRVPDLDEVNKAFTYWDNAHDLIQASVGRKTGQLQTVKKLGSATFAALVGSAGGGAVGGGLAAPAGYALAELMQSPQWRTISASLKSRLAKAVAQDNAQLVQRLLGRFVAQGGAQATAGAQ